MLHGSLRASMKAEHCEREDSTEPFDTTNGAKGATSVKEWEFVNEPKSGTVYLQAEASHLKRARVALKEFERKMGRVNEQLRASHHPPMAVEELIGGRLYTGPMYEKYNAVLRACSGVAFLKQRWTALCRGNQYTTSIHAINSCVIKLSKLTVACRIWRGFTGARLPPSFWQKNTYGVMGGVEFGFSSTTVDRAQAIRYAAGRASTVFEMQMGMVDRGADVGWLSQYPEEKEVLFPPLMGQEVLRTRVEGSTLVVEARLSLNLSSLTLEQVCGRLRQLRTPAAHAMAPCCSVHVARPNFSSSPARRRCRASGGSCCRTWRRTWSSSCTTASTPDACG
jgi:NLR family CARD domain-containing protein 3